MNHPDNIDPTIDDLKRDALEDLNDLQKQGGYIARTAEAWLCRATRAERLARDRSVLLRRVLDHAEDWPWPASLIEDIRRHLRDDGALPQG
mgnify:CR=1 FL=1